MNICELCGEKHTGPCYAEWREHWRQKELNHWLDSLKAKYAVVEIGDRMVATIQYNVDAQTKD